MTRKTAKKLNINITANDIKTERRSRNIVRDRNVFKKSSPIVPPAKTAKRKLANDNIEPSKRRKTADQSFITKYFAPTQSAPIAEAAKVHAPSDLASISADAHPIVESTTAHGHAILESIPEDVPPIVESTSAPILEPDEENQIAVIEFRVGEIVWAKIKGFPHWPAVIKSFPSDRMAIVIWFNDYRKTKIYRTQLFKFLANFETFAKRFDDVIGLKTAAQEGLMCYGQNMNK